MEIIDEFKVENTECVQPTCLLEECEIGSKKDESEQIGTSRVPESSVINTERVHEKTAPLAREAYLSPAKLVR